ncbi:hypothetical protein OIO90_004964 [Microbotryomycetes sp. JL221]|nr:hypothetical protein OIO90_004964 [Microbotryomycetes sp. JL221]
MPVLELRPPSTPSSRTRVPLSPSSRANALTQDVVVASSFNKFNASNDKEQSMSRTSTLSSLATSQIDNSNASYRSRGPDVSDDDDDEDGIESMNSNHSAAKGASRRGYLSAGDSLRQSAGSKDYDVDDDMDLQSTEGLNGGTRSSSLADVLMARSISKASITSSSSKRLEDDCVTEDEAELAVLHVEVRLRPSSAIRTDVLQRQVATWLRTSFDTFDPDSEAKGWQEVDLLNKHIDRIWFGECTGPDSAQASSIAAAQVQLEIHVYAMPSSSRAYDVSTGSGDKYGDDDDENEEDNVPAASVMHLPSRHLEGLWDTLVYEDDVKSKLLSYIYSTVLFSDAMVDFNVVTWNRVVLLHGPPGTGKTSLCRALAQKLAIRLSGRYDSGKLVEINSHSLFSKWFSESGKLVQRLFAAVTDMVDDESCFVVVLIDEVESLTTARAGAMSGREPSDALRVVNALLTQLDKLKARKNVLVVTTSNLSDAIDGAFIDRADIKKYIGLPPPQAIYTILESCLREIMKAGLVRPCKLYNWNGAKSLFDSNNRGDSIESKCSFKLFELAHTCHGMSGRTLRRLPVLAHANHIRTHNRVSLENWIDAMCKSAQQEAEQMNRVKQAAEGV